MERLRLNKDRLQLAWVTAAEGEKFASKIKEMQSIVDKVSKEEVEKNHLSVQLNLYKDN